MSLSKSVQALQLSYVEAIRKLHAFAAERNLVVSLDFKPPPPTSKLAALLMGATPDPVVPLSSTRSSVSSACISNIPRSSVASTSSSSVPRTSVSSTISSTIPRSSVSSSSSSLSTTSDPQPTPSIPPSTTVSLPLPPPTDDGKKVAPTIPPPVFSNPSFLPSSTPISIPPPCTPFENKPTIPSTPVPSLSLLPHSTPSSSNVSTPIKTRRPPIALEKANTARIKAEADKQRAEERRRAMKEREQKALLNRTESRLNQSNREEKTRPIAESKLKPTSKPKVVSKVAEIINKPTPTPVAQPPLIPPPPAQINKIKSMLTKMRDERAPEVPPSNPPKLSGVSEDIPEWSMEPKLSEFLRKQITTDPNNVFGEFSTPDLSEIFGASLTYKGNVASVLSQFSVESPLLKRK
ncbi:hypothetical protein RCL1_007139 [Eukaryota sp. TZLM3-RCL]